MRRFWAWFTEDTVMPRAWLYLGLAFAIKEALDLIADLVLWLT